METTRALSTATANTSFDFGDTVAAAPHADRHARGHVYDHESGQRPAHLAMADQ
jgi:hypothetical protein